MSQDSPIETRALALLSSGITPEQCANALGVSASRISQLISDESFSAKLAEARFEALRKHNARDSELDALEDTIIAQLKACSGFIMDPMKLAKMLQVVNAAKRRGSSTPDAVTSQQTIIKLNIPIALVQRFSLSGNNQVVTVGAQDLVTIQSAQMRALNADATLTAQGAG